MSAAQITKEHQKRREDACALRKLSRNTMGLLMDFARSALGVRCVFASLSFFTDAQLSTVRRMQNSDV